MPLGLRIMDAGNILSESLDAFKCSHLWGCFPPSLLGQPGSWIGRVIGCFLCGPIHGQWIVLIVLALGSHIAPLVF